MLLKPRGVGVEHVQAGWPSDRLGAPGVQTRVAEASGELFEMSSGRDDLVRLGDHQ